MIFFFFFLLLFCCLFYYFFSVVVFVVYVPPICLFIISGEFAALHQLSIKKDPLEIQHPKFENSRRSFSESVHER